MNDDDVIWDNRTQQILAQSQSRIEQLEAELADMRFEIDGCRDTIAKQQAELRRLRQRFLAGINDYPRE